MDERDFDIIVVGSGIAGAVAAYVAAKKGKSVLVVERGEYAGAKNMTGGRIYAHSLRSLFAEYDPHFDWESIPFERKITHERLALMDPTRSVGFDFTSDKLSDAGRDSYSVLRAPFDQWLAELAEEAGADYVCGMPVDEILKDDAGRVCGIRAGEDEMTAHVVIDCEGVNSLLAERCLDVSRPKPVEMAVGIKETFALPAEKIEDRFLLPEGEGAAMLFVGDCTHASVGGGFLYTNKESISLGLVATIENLSQSDTTIYQALEDFKNHPAVAPIIRGAELVEHSGHMVSEGGFNMIPQYVFDGCLFAGDTAMFCMNLGYQVRGMDFAVASGRFAAEAACDAIDAGDVSATGMASYKAKLEDSFVIKDLATFKAWPETMEKWDSMFADYPAMAAEVFEALFVVDGEPQQHLSKRLMPIVKQRGMFKLGKEICRALKAL